MTDYTSCKKIVICLYLYAMPLSSSKIKDVFGTIHDKLLSLGTLFNRLFTYQKNPVTDIW